MIDGEAVGEWLWQQLNERGMSGDLQRCTLRAAAGDIGGVMPYATPVQPSRPGYDRAQCAAGLAGATPHFWPVEHLDALEFDPLLHRLLREEPIAL
ncbi:hypothetical protein AB0G73_34490, partial [Streptomyces sp. NPDC020719]